ncbi:MAG: bacteriohemerythrin [Desulfobacterales bacterium]|nr:bacteriohemerythrin [Desulfobacterales bacterium]
MVSLMNWSDDLLTGIEEIDDQHRNLFLLINRLILHKRTHGPRENLLDVLHVLVAYSQAHFRSEDHHMAASEYPLARSHSHEHLTFTKNINNFMIDYERGDEELSDKMLIFLRKWWVTHVAESDQMFVKHLKETGYIPS